MLEKEVFTFLKLLKQNNNRDWFKKNKHLHDASKHKKNLWRRNVLRCCI